jgi:hypothetical protein
MGRLPTAIELRVRCDLRNDRLGNRVRLEQERVRYQVVQKVVFPLHR